VRPHNVEPDDFGFPVRDDFADFVLRELCGGPVLSGIYHTGHLQGGVVSALLRNFTVAPIVEIASGRPFNIATGQDSNFDFDPLTDRPTPSPR
jgi:hypothetical protein